MSEVDTKFAIMLSEVNGIGPVKYQKIIRHFQNYEMFSSNSDKDIFNECGLDDKHVSKIIEFSRGDKIDQVLNKAESLGVAIICLGQADYPEFLTNIYAPPTVLYLKGKIQNLSKPAVAVVGSRTPTAYGRAMTRKIVSELAVRGLTIISGMAWGIDSEAHRTAMNVGGATGAIFGCGIDIIYPSTHRDLADKILQNGFWLSEFPFGTHPDRHNFPRRNRIISGLSQAVVVVEAAARSGALVTANLALDQGREVFAVPGQADNPMSSGTINLIKQGASVATSADDILESLGWELSQQLEQKPKVQQPINLEPEEQKICDFVGKGSAHFDELVRKLGYTPAKVSAILLKLELSGLIVRRPGNYVART